MSRQWFIGPLVVLLAAPALAEEPSGSAEEGFGLLREGARVLMESLFSEMEPALDDMQQGLGEALRRMEPMMRDLGAMMGELDNYHAPEMLPNGDIIIRRKSPGEIVAEPGGEIEI